MTTRALVPIPRTAIVPAAGLGTRFLPATKTVPKELLPVVDTPGIELVAAEAHRTGLPYDLAGAALAPDIAGVARIGLALDPAQNPARPLYIKPPDAHPNPAAPIARTVM